MKCTGPAYKGDNFLEAFRRALDRCGEPAVWQTPEGPRCEACCKRMEDSILPGSGTIASILLDNHGVPAEQRRIRKEPIQ